MRIFFDTSVLVAAIVTTHPAHEHVFPLLMQVKQKVNTGVIAAHSLAELYAILTKLPIRPRISPALALELIQRGVVETCEIVALSVYDYLVMLQYLTRSHIAGAAVYDGLPSCCLAGKCRSSIDAELKRFQARLSRACR